MSTERSARVFAIHLAAFTLVAAACTSKPPESTQDYVAKVTAERAAKDHYLSTDKDSPVPPERRAELLPLAYFPIDPEYDVPAGLKPSNDPTVVEMPTSTGTERKMRRVGSLEFSLKGQPLKLTAFVEVGAPNLDKLFVPFRDLSSMTETYSGGRYIDLDRTKTGVYEIDFNRAYHPYCYYNLTWECPIPPPENRLKVPIRAGERMKAAGRDGKS
jgi:uncharacterized protein (DUF1684 family)